MAAIGALAFVGGIVFKALGGTALVVQAYRSATTWRETHRTLAPAVARSIEKIVDVGAQAITNTQAHLSNECSKITGKFLEIAVFGVIHYAISASYPSSCKDKPDNWVCTSNDIIQVVSNGFLAGASMYAVIQMVSSSKKSEESSVQTIPTSGSQKANLTLKELIAKQKAALGKA